MRQLSLLTKTVPKKFWVNPFVVLFGSMLLFLASQFVAALSVQLFSGFLATDSQRVFCFIAVNLVVMLGSLATIFKISGYTWRSIGWRQPPLKSLWLIPPAFLVYLAISLVFTMVATRLIPGFQTDQVQDVGLSNLQGGDFLFAFLTLVVLTPILEETLFRGVLFKGLRVHLPFWASAIVVSGLFAVAHGQWNVAVDTFALSLILCFLVERSKSIVPAIALHALKNLAAFLLLFVFKT